MRSLLTVCIVLLLGSTLYIYAKDRNPGEEKVTKTTGQASIGGAFSLVDQDGKPVTEQNYRGKTTLVFFGFTNCPDICLVAAATMGKAMKTLTDAQRAKLNMLFITLDPERDTPAVMKKWLEDYDTRMIGLTGTKENVETAKAAYKVYSQVRKKDGSYTVDHSSYMYLMNKDGAYLAHFPHDVALEKLMEALNANIE